MFHVPRVGRGGGTAVIYKSNLRMTKQHTKKYTSFEVTETVLCTGKSLTLHIYLVYIEV